MPIDLQTWLLAELGDVTSRLEHQVLDLVPPGRRGERPGGGNSITWTTLHIARHAALALAVLGADRLPSAPIEGGRGLDEAEEDWAADLDPLAVERYALAVLEQAALVTPLVDLDAVPDSEGILVRAGVSRVRYPWLYAQWSGQRAAFFVRWPVIGHALSHVGEAIATRNRLGLSRDG